MSKDKEKNKNKDKDKYSPTDDAPFRDEHRPKDRLDTYATWEINKPHYLERSKAAAKYREGLKKKRHTDPFEHSDQEQEQEMQEERHATLNLGELVAYRLRKQKEKELEKERHAQMTKDARKSKGKGKRTKVGRTRSKRSNCDK